MSDLSGGPDFQGPATLLFDDAALGEPQFDVEVELRGHSQPIDGLFRWYGRVRPHEDLAAFMKGAGGRSRSGTLRTAEGDAGVTVGEVDFWGRYRVQGVSAPPYRVAPAEQPDEYKETTMAIAPSDAALDRALALIEPDDLRAAADTSKGYVELLGDTPAPTPTAASRAMNNKLVASIYEKLWRPAGIAMMGVGGLSMSAERTKAVTDLRLSGEMSVLDVASGPGNFTQYLSTHLSGDGLAIGFDISAPMIERAVRDNRGPHAAYVRGDAQALPFADGTFDAVCCYAALYLIPEPLAVTAELVRVLRPGGRIAIMTSYGRNLTPVRAALNVGSERIGVTMFDKDTFTGLFELAGMTEIEQDIRGLAQFVCATKQS